MKVRSKYVTSTVFVSVVLVLAMCVRLYKITTPPLDWHSFRQADTASVTRMYVQKGIDILHPTFHDLSNIASGKDNPHGYRMVEFPLINASVAFIVRALPFLSVDATGRFASVLFSLGTLFVLFRLVQELSGKRVAYITLIIGSVFPYFVYYSRTILPEAGVVFLSTASLYFFYLWLKEPHVWKYCTSLALLSLALLVKPFALFLFPVFCALWYIGTRKRSHALLMILFLASSCVPLYFWRDWISQFPEGIPASDWLYNGNGIRFRPAWLRWLGYERLTKLMLGYVGILFLPLSLLGLTKKEAVVYGTWWLCILGYFTVIATGNVQHDYYQNLMVPILLITFARGACMLESWVRARRTPAFSLTLTFTLVCLALGISWLQVKEYYKVNHWEYVRAGAAVQRLTPPTALVIAPAFGDTQFLYQTNRRGWPIGYEIEKKRALGATHYVTTSKDDEAHMLMKQYTVLEETSEYVVIDLTQPRK